MYYPRFTKVIIHYFLTKKPSIPRRNRVNWHYVRDDILFFTIKVVSRHHNTQQYGAILPIELTTEDIRNTTAYKEYYACATREAAPKPKASARKKKGGSAASTTPPTPIAAPTPITTVVAGPRLSAAAKDEGTGSKLGVSDVPSDDSEEELSWNSFDDEDVDEQTKGKDKSKGEKNNESDDDDDQDEAKNVNDEEISKIGEQEATESDEGKDEATKSDEDDDKATESDRESKDKETREQEEESFDPIPRTPEESKDDDNNEEDQGLRIGEEERMHEEEEADELYRDAQSWISALAKQTDARSLFNELLDTSIDLSNFIMNRLGVDTLTPELLAGPTYELMRGSFNSLTELEYHLEEVYKVTTDQLDWVNPEGQQYPHNLLQPLPLISDNRGRRVIPFEHFINNDLEYLRGVIQRRVEDLQLDGTLNDVRNALDDHLKGIRMQYLPTTIWRKGDKDRAAAMIQAIDKMLKTQRIIRSLERFVGRRQYEGDF
nr:hypothetical protein [Tanacetum cinerariifolium]